MLFRSISGYSGAQGTSGYSGYSGYSGSSASSISIANDIATATNLYPTFVTATSGTASTLNTSNAKLLYKPSTGEWQASIPIASNGINVNNATVSASMTIASGYNGISVGAITIASGQSVTVASGQKWLVL